jgi:hypothetical protein
MDGREETVICTKRVQFLNQSRVTQDRVFIAVKNSDGFVARKQVTSVFQGPCWQSCDVVVNFWALRISRGVGVASFIEACEESSDYRFDGLDSKLFLLRRS